MKVAIIGTAPLSVKLAPYDDKEWTIWACSPGNMNQLPRVDAWFELHAMAEMIGQENQVWSAPWLGWLRTQKCPIYMQEHNDAVPQAIVFPRDVLLKKFGRNWFSSSVAWMMAYAIHLGVEEIGLFGVDMAHGQEHYTAQKAGCLRFIEIAKELGITVTVPWESCLARQPPLYGYNEATHFARRLNVMRNALNASVQAMRAQRENLDREIAYSSGAVEQIDYFIRTWVDGLDDAQLQTELPADAEPKSQVKFQNFSRADVSGLYVPDGTVPPGTVVASSGDALERSAETSKLVDAAITEARDTRALTRELRGKGNGSKAEVA